LLAFYMDLGDYSGRLLEFDVSFSDQVIKNFGVGGGLKWFDLQLKNSFSGGGAATFEYTILRTDTFRVR
jgi:hypothetical protein